MNLFLAGSGSAHLPWSEPHLDRSPTLSSPWSATARATRPEGNFYFRCSEPRVTHCTDGAFYNYKPHSVTSMSDPCCFNQKCSSVRLNVNNLYKWGAAVTSVGSNINRQLTSWLWHNVMWSAADTNTTSPPWGFLKTNKITMAASQMSHLYISTI